MKKVVLLLILLASVLSTAGCAEKTEANATNSDVSLETSNIIEVTSLEQINTSLQEGPVFLKIGSERCSACKKMKPILKELATEYEGKVTVMSVDADKNLDLAEYFNVSFIPDSSVIVGIENGKYVFMQKDGSTSTDRSEAGVSGLYEKGMYKELLDLALLQDGGNNSDVGNNSSENEYTK